jgi:hypothetical protein
MITVPEALAVDLARVMSLLRNTASTRLGAPLSGPFATRAGAGRALAQALAVAVQGLEDADQPAMPRWRTLPRLADLAVGDQVRVLAHDLTVSAPMAPAMAWTPEGRMPTSQVLRDVAAIAAEVVKFLE